MKSILLSILLLLPLSIYSQVIYIKNQDDLQREVLNSSIPVVIDIFSERCGPCQKMKPVFEKLSSEFEGKVKFVAISTQSSNGAWSYFNNILQVPTLISWFNGQEVLPRSVGAHSIQDLRNHVKKLQSLAKP